MTPEELSGFASVSDPRLHPDGVRVAFRVSRLDLEEDRYDAAIWLWDGTVARRFTAGPGDSSPRWSPDGMRLAFLRSPRKGEPAQLWVMPAAGGEGRRLTDLSLGVAEVEWSPDGTRLAVVGKTWTEEWEGLDEEERARKPRRIIRAYWRADDRGWIHDRRSHVYVVAADGEGDDPELLTPGDFNETGIAWHPGGDRIAFLSARDERRGLEPGAGVYEVDVTGGEARRLVADGLWSHVSYSPDGGPAVVGRPERWDHPAVSSIYRVEADGLTDLLPGLDRSPFPLSPPAAPAGPQWVEGGFLTLVEDAGSVRVVLVADDGSRAGVLSGPRLITGASPAPDLSVVAFVATDPTDPGELHLLADGEERVVTDLNAAFRAETGLIAPEPFTVESEGIELQAWALLPPGEGKVPLLLNIHGGPATQYGWGFFDEFQVYASAGYGVVAANPRGSSGRGREFVRSIVGEWMSEDPPDLRDFRRVVDAALERFPRLDPERMGVMGGSYGGYATVRLLAVDDRFRSAVVERSLTFFPSFAGTSDIGPWFDRIYLERSLPADWDDYLRASPLFGAGRIRTPTLVVHSEKDFRTPIEQGEQLFVMLQRMGVPSEMVRFPDESHELSRSGSPRHRRERFEAILDWHGRHLAGD